MSVHKSSTQSVLSKCCALLRSVIAACGARLALLGECFSAAMSILRHAISCTSLKRPATSAVVTCAVTERDATDDALVTLSDALALFGAFPPDHFSSARTSPSFVTVAELLDLGKFVRRPEASAALSRAYVSLVVLLPAQAADVSALCALVTTCSELCIRIRGTRFFVFSSWLTSLCRGSALDFVCKVGLLTDACLPVRNTAREQRLRDVARGVTRNLEFAAVRLLAQFMPRACECAEAAG